MNNLDNAENEVFEFMLQENAKTYEEFDRHFDSIEKTFTLYLAIIAALITVIGYLYKDKNNIHLFALNDFEIFCSAFIVIIGIFSFFKVMEHRLLVISYTKSLNLNRKWFVDRFKNLNLSEYLFWKADVSQPKYYRPYRYFYWELLGLATLNAPFLSFFIINLITKFNFRSENYLVLNWLSFFVISAAYIVFMMYLYRKKSNSLEAELKNRTDIK
jgi:hypothetical protein